MHPFTLTTAATAAASAALLAGLLAAPALAASRAAAPAITGPLRISGRAGQTVTAQYQCPAQPASSMWGVGNDGNGTIANITPLASPVGAYQVKLIPEREWVWISNPGGGCSSIQVRIVGRAHKASGCSIGGVGVTFGGTTIAVVAIKGPEGGIIHEVRARTNFEIGTCPPKKGELYYRLQIKVRRGLRFVWVSTGTSEKKDISNLPAGTKFEMTSRRDCNPRGKASYRVRLFAAPGINGDGTASPPETKYLPTPKGRQKHCR